MNIIKISEFYEKLKQSGNVNSMLTEKIQHIKNEDDLKKIIENEIIPLSRKMGMKFTLDELMDYERQVSRTHSNIDLENISGGVSNKSLLFGGLASLMFFRFGDLVTGLKTQAISLDQVIDSTENQIVSINHSPKPILNPLQPKIENSTTVTPRTEEKASLDQQLFSLTKNTEVNPEKNPKLSQSSTDSTNATTNTEKQQTSDPITLFSEEHETRTAAKLSNPTGEIDETHNAPTDTIEKQVGLSKEQILAATDDTTDATQTSKDIETKGDAITPSDSTAIDHSKNLISLELINKLSDYEKLYYLEALNLCDPYIYNETKVTENIRLYNGYTDSTVMDITNMNSCHRNYLQDEGIGSANLMKILYPSSAGILNTATNNDRTVTLGNCNPSPENMSNIIFCLFKYRNSDPKIIARLALLNNWEKFGKGFLKRKFSANNPKEQKKLLDDTKAFDFLPEKYGEALIDIKKNLAEIPDPETKRKQLLCDFLNYKIDTTSKKKEDMKKREKNKISTFFSILQNAIYMIDHQEKMIFQKKKAV